MKKVVIDLEMPSGYRDAMTGKEIPAADVVKDLIPGDQYEINVDEGKKMMEITKNEVLPSGHKIVVSKKVVI